MPKSSILDINESFDIYSGIKLSYHKYHSEQVHHHKPLNHVLEISYCNSGRLGLKMKDNMQVYLGAGDLAMQSMSCCADAKMTLPTSYCEILTVTLDFDNINADEFPLLKSSGFSFKKLKDNFYNTSYPIALPSSDEIKSIFAVLFLCSDEHKAIYLKLKIQELLLFLSDLSTKNTKEINGCNAEQIAVINELHDLLISDLSQKLTIEELSKQFHMNSTSLKQIFKAVYGLPIAGYMKNYRIQYSVKLLRETDKNISLIAKQCGYENQSKFSKAFKAVIGVLPSEFRKEIR